MAALAHNVRERHDLRLAILAVFLATNLVASAQSPLMDAPYHPITPRQSLRWFVTSTIGPQHLAVGVFSSALGTAVDRPEEYGPHWGGFADRFGMGMSGTVTSNAIEA